MANRVSKPKKSVSQLVLEMKNVRGITFNYVNDSSAIDYLSDVNNYLRTASYRKNYQKYQRGTNQGKYINLDFSYLTEMSVIDMHYRFLIQKMCSDIEHAAAHNNCILFDLNPGTTVAPQEITEFVKGVEGITKSKRRKRLSSRAVLEYIALIYVYDRIVTGKVKKYRLEELDLLINNRMVEKISLQARLW